MLTRLKVSGFKNLVAVDVRFGPFTCIAGPNAVGKSNLFDAIRFLSLAANDTLMNAALAVRSEGGRTGDIRSLFHRSGETYDKVMTFEVEMILPPEAVDDLGQRALAKITLVRYQLSIGYRTDNSLPTLGSLVLLTENLQHISLGDASSVLQFPHSSNQWRRSVLSGRRTSPFISTQKEGDKVHVRLSQDGVSGRPKSFLAANLPRTVLSTVNATESPTALVARREMQSWQLLQLEPSALREPDFFTTPPGMLADGSHLPATLYYLARSSYTDEQKNGDQSPIYDRVALRLSEFIDDVWAVGVDRDQQRELLTLQVTERDGTVYPARSLSDGTLRFLALAVLDLNPSASGLICMEEPENGIHPSRIPAIINLLQDIACDVESPVGPDNPLRQVIINTHSPVVVNQVPDDSLLVAQLVEVSRDSQRFKAARFGWLPDTWRQRVEPDLKPAARGHLLAYLNPVLPAESEHKGPRLVGKQTARRVIDRDDFRQLGIFDAQMAITN